jgi:hypothetical protein
MVTKVVSKTSKKLLDQWHYVMADDMAVHARFKLLCQNGHDSKN